MSDLDQRGRPRVVVTGVGVKTPAGNDVASFWEQLRAGRGSARTIESFDPAGYVTGALVPVDGGLGMGH